jgi:chromate transporter
MDSTLTSDTPRVKSVPPREVTLAEAFPTWCRIAALSFGGPAGQIAVMHRILVEEKRWISEERFLHALNYCMLLPGPEAQQLATYVGWLMQGLRGGLMAGVLFILPGIASILALSVIYVLYEQTTPLQGIFFGLKAAVLAVVIEAVLRIGRRVLKNRLMLGLAVASFIGIFLFRFPFPVVVLAAALFGLIGNRFAPQLFQVLKGHGGTGDRQDEAEATTILLGEPPRPTLARAFVVTGVCGTLWFAPLVLVAATLGMESVHFQEGVFFSKAAVVTFGGAYAVLAYVTQQAVDRYHWLTMPQMTDGLAMAETTPGPLIMVVQFVGFLGGWNHPGPLAPMSAAILGALLTTWVTFVPCFYWIFLGSPYIERLRGNHALNAALSSVTAAVVGAVLNLAVSFGLTILFSRVDYRSLAGMTLPVPDSSTLDWPALGLTLLALILTFRWKRGMATTLAVCALLGLVVQIVRRD